MEANEYQELAARTFPKGLDGNKALKNYDREDI